MSWPDRDEGKAVTDAPLLRRMMPHLMRGRNEAIVLFDQRVDIAPLQTFLGSEAAQRVDARFFHVVLAALVRTLHERPDLNRFVVRRRLHQRRQISLSFAVKKAMRDDGALTTVKLNFDGRETLADVVDKVEAAIGAGRGDERTVSEQEMVVVTWLPHWLLGLIMAAQRRLDAWNLLPAAMIRNDPLYASCFVANLGSVGLDAPYHHLFEYGSCHIFVAVGRTQTHLELRDGVPVEVPRVHLRYTFDERADDGINCRHGFEAMRRVLEDPYRWLGCLAADGSDAATIWPREDWTSEDGTFQVRD